MGANQTRLATKLGEGCGGEGFLVDFFLFILVSIQLFSFVWFFFGSRSPFPSFQTPPQGVNLLLLFVDFAQSRRQHFCNCASLFGSAGKKKEKKTSGRPQFRRFTLKSRTRSKIKKKAPKKIWQRRFFFSFLALPRRKTTVAERHTQMAMEIRKRKKNESIKNEELIDSVQRPPITSIRQMNG